MNKATKLSVHSGCILCFVYNRPKTTKSSTLILLLLFVVVVVVFYYYSSSSSSTAYRETKITAESGTLTTRHFTTSSLMIK